MFLRFIVLWFAIYTIRNVTFAAKILAVFPYAFQSQVNFVQPYLDALAERGHELTIINAFHWENQLANTKYITVTEIYKLIDDIYDSDYAGPFTKWHESTVVAKYFYQCNLFVLRNREVQNLLSTMPVFELVVIEVSHYEALNGLAQYFHAPLIGVSAYGSTWLTDYMVGNSAPSIYEPISPQGYVQNTNLIKRMQNLFYITEEWLLDRYVYMPPQIQLYKKFFPNASVTLTELRRNFSLLLINRHFSLGRPRANVPNIIEIAGMHIPLVPPALPQQLETFINEAPNGVIYMSMGAEIQSKFLPPSTLHVLHKTFRRLKQRVIWKYESANLPNVTENIYFDAWLPQIAILAHPNVKLFITHAGLLSIIEATYYGKLVIGLPMFFDQFENIAYLVKAGTGLKLDYNTLHENELYAKIQQLLSNSKFSKNAQASSQRFRDHPLQPLDAALWWTEYVLRYKGAAHMHIPEQNLALIPYYSLDTICVIFGKLAPMLLIVIFIAYKFIFSTVLSPINEAPMNEY